MVSEAQVRRLKEVKEMWRSRCNMAWNTLRSAKEYIKEQNEEIRRLRGFHCPIWQCGGKMKTIERPTPNGKDADEYYPDGYAGDWQTPDLVCKSCGGIYHFQGFKKKKIKADDGKKGVEKNGM